MFLLQIIYYQASDKIYRILLDIYRSYDVVKITVLGVEIRIGRVFEAGGEQSKMADNELVVMDLSLGIFFLNSPVQRTLQRP